jgi:hypothetical protein
MICPPVGKSGAGMILKRASSDSRGSSIKATTASHSSPRLCGGMFVAIPAGVEVGKDGLGEDKGMGQDGWGMKVCEIRRGS